MQHKLQACKSWKVLEHGFTDANLYNLALYVLPSIKSHIVSDCFLLLFRSQTINALIFQSPVRLRVIRTHAHCPADWQNKELIRVGSNDMIL